MPRSLAPAMRLLSLLVATVLVAVPAPAEGAQASVSDTTLTYTADAGEVNLVVLSMIERGGERLIRIREFGDNASDGSAVTPRATAPCQGVAPAKVAATGPRAAGKAHPEPQVVECPLRERTTVTLEDEDDSLSINPPLVTADTLEGGVGDDIIAAGQGDDALSGGEGKDILAGALGADAMSGGPGADTVRYDADAARYSANTEGGFPVAIDIGGGPNDGGDQDGPPGARDDIATDVENLTGGPGDDLVTGDSGANELAGAGGRDTVIGGEGPDLLDGGRDPDRLEGGPGSDGLFSRDGGPDELSCGEDAGGGDLDKATVDPGDTVDADCEQVDPAPPRPEPPPDRVGPRVGISRRASVAAGGLVAIRLSCPAAESAGCSGTLRLERVGRRVRLGSRSFRIAAGRSAVVRVRLSSEGRRLLGRLRRLRVRATATARDAAGNVSTSRADLLLTAPRRR